MRRLASPHGRFRFAARRGERTGSAAGEPLEFSARRALRRSRVPREAAGREAAEGGRPGAGRSRAAPRAAGRSGAKRSPPPRRGSAPPTRSCAWLIAAQVAARRERLAPGAGRRSTSLLGRPRGDGRAPAACSPSLDQGSHRRVRPGPPSARFDPARHPRAHRIACSAELGRGRAASSRQRQTARAELVGSRNELARSASRNSPRWSKGAKLGRRARRRSASAPATSRSLAARSVATADQRSRRSRCSAATRGRARARPTRLRPGPVAAIGAARRAIRLPTPGSRRRSSKDWAPVTPNGIRSRGLTLATRARSCRSRARPPERSAFPGPFRSYDGVVIIDHGGGWMSLLVNVASPLQAGREGPARRAAWPCTWAELAWNCPKMGGHVSPALIAGSSQTLSKGAERGLEARRPPATGHDHEARPANCFRRSRSSARSRWCR